MALTTVPASLSATALTLTTAAQPNITSVGTLTGLTVSGNIAGTLTTAAQTNITSVGTLSSLTVSGALNGTLSTAAQTNITSLGTLSTLAVNSGTTNTVATFTSSDAGAGINLTDNSGTSTLQTNGANLRVGVDEAGAVSSSAIQFRVDGSTKATLDSNGNLGVGAAPVSGYGHLQVRGSFGYINEDGSNTKQMYLRTNYDTGNPAIQVATAHDLLFATSNVTRMTIDSSGNVGIGESNPDASLHITSNTPIISFDESDASKEFRIGSYGGAFAIRDETSSAYRVVVDGSGNVGIGTTTLNKIFNIADPAQGGETLKLHFEASSTNDKWAIYSYDRTNSHYTDLSFGGNYLYLKSGGNVGVGDSNPSQKLNVAGNIMLEGNNQYLYLTNVGTGNSGIYVRGNTASSYLRSHSTGKFTWEVTGSQKMELDANGQLGIGASPSCALEVVNSGEARIKARSTNNNWAGLDLEAHSAQSNYIFFRDNSAERARIQVTDSDQLIISNGNTPNERLRVTSTGPSVSNAGSTGNFAYNVVVNKASGANDTSYNSNFSSAHTISSSVSAPMEYFKTVALINTRAYQNYVNIKTNLTSNGIMFLGHFLGYMYGYGNKEAFVGGYTYQGSVISQYTNIPMNGTGTMAGTAYRASDGALCFKIQIGHTGYTEGQMIFRFHSHGESTTTQCTVVAAQVRNDGTNHYA